MSNTEKTPTPWYGIYPDYDGKLNILTKPDLPKENPDDPDEYQRSDFDSAVYATSDDYELIVRAVNSHDALVAVLEYALKYNMNVEKPEWWGQLTDALKLAKGEQ